jgi:acetylglutamate kinase
MKDKPLILIKYGGNAMLNDHLKKEVVHQIVQLSEGGYSVVLVHGGGPFIKNILELVNIESEFIGGHRKTTPEAMKYIEMALKGEVNGSLVNLLNAEGLRAVGLSGKDGRMVVAKKRLHAMQEDGKEVLHDLGQVGDVIEVDTTLLSTLLSENYLPVMTCVASDESGQDYNINADMFAGHLAGALEADHYLILTDVDGLLRDINNPESLIRQLQVKELKTLYGSVIKGGMVPKLESCEIALQKGAASASIINGTRPESISDAVKKDKSIGTKICL